MWVFACLKWILHWVPLQNMYVESFNTWLKLDNFWLPPTAYCPLLTSCGKQFRVYHILQHHVDGILAMAVSAYL